MKISYFSFNPRSVLFGFVLTFVLGGCLSTEQADFEPDSPFGDEFGDPTGETPLNPGEEGGSETSIIEEEGGEAELEGGEDPLGEGGEEEGGEEEGGSLEEGGESPEEGGTESSPPPGFCENYVDTCGEWPGQASCADWWAGLEAGVDGDASGSTKACSSIHLEWAQASNVEEEVVEYCAAAAGGEPCVVPQAAGDWDINDYASCTEDNKEELKEFAQEVFITSCMGASCHGEGTQKGSLEYILDFDHLVDAQLVLPGNPDGSKIYQKMDAGQMPPDYATQPQPENEDIEKVYQWIQCLSSVEAEVIYTNEQLLGWMRQDLEAELSSSRKFIRYISLVHLHNAGASAQQLSTYRQAVVKLMNGLTWRDKVQGTISYADPATELVIRVDVRDFEWDEFPLDIPELAGTNVWTQVAEAYPYASSLDESDDWDYLVELTATPVPYVNVDWFVATASIPPLYHNLLGLPETLQELTQMLGIDVQENIDGFFVARGGILDSGVSSSNRILERHSILSNADGGNPAGKVTDYEGAFWLSYDFASNTGDQNISAHPLDFVEDGGEVIFNLPNGFQAYYIADAVGNRLDVAPTAIVKDDQPGFEGETIVNGRSCMKCHFSGINDATDVIGTLAQSGFNLFAAEDEGAILALYDDDALQEVILEDKARFQDGLESAAVTLVEEPVDEQIFLTSERHVTDLTQTDVAAHLYMSWEELVANDGADSLKQIPDLLQFMTQGGQQGTLKRETFDSTYNDFLCFLDAGDPLGFDPEGSEQGCSVFSLCNTSGSSSKTTLVIGGVELQANGSAHCSSCRALPVGSVVDAVLTVETSDGVVTTQDIVLDLSDDDEGVLSVESQPGVPPLLTRKDASPIQKCVEDKLLINAN